MCFTVDGGNFKMGEITQNFTQRKIAAEIKSGKKPVICSLDGSCACIFDLKLLYYLHY